MTTATENFVNQVQEKLIFIRQLPEYIDPDKDDETLIVKSDDASMGIPSFEDWVEGRRQDFEYGITEEKMFQVYSRLKCVALENTGWFK